MGIDDKNHKTRNLQVEKNSITDNQVKILIYNGKEFSKNFNENDFNQMVCKRIDDFKRDEIKIKQNHYMLMSQYKNYFRIVVEGNEENLSFAFDPEKQKFIYFDPKNNQIDINKHLIVTSKKFMKKNKENISINKSTESQNDIKIDDIKDPSTNYFKIISQGTSNISNNNGNMSVKSKKSHKNFLWNDLNISFGNLNLKTDKENFLDVCKNQDGEKYFFLLGLKLKINFIIS